MNKPSHAPIYRNPKFPAEKRTKDLLKRMPLEEEPAQIMCAWQEKATKLVNDWGKFAQSYL